MENTKSVDLTKGNIVKQLIKFSIPLLIGNLLQQIYFIADSIIVGQWIGSTALAAVGATSSITILMVFFFMGMANGAGVIISQYYGAREMHKVAKVIKAAGIFTIIVGAICSVGGALLTDTFLRWINIPPDVFEQSSNYLRVCVLGMLPMLIYNMGASSLQAMGDSKTPLYYLLIASVINIVLDIFFVKGLGTDVEGTAYATIIAQGVAAILVILSIKKKLRGIAKSNIEIPKMGYFIKNITIVGFPIAIQNVVINFSNIVVQSHINGLGSDVMAAWSAFSRLDTFIILPFQSFGLAVLTFVGQNYGAKNYHRIQDGVKAGVVLSTIVTISIGGILCLSPRFFFSFFTNSETVILEATSMMYFMVPFYFALAIARIYVSAISGTGDSVTPMIVNIVFMCVFRVIVLPLLANVIDHNMMVVYYTYWSSWFLSLVSIKICYNIKVKNKLGTVKILE
ncbi:MAG: MATE family efflux transporter [Anaerovoracaceae bacterium]